MGGSFGPDDVVVLERGVVLDAEAEVDGFGGGTPAFDHDVLVESRAGFEIAKGGGVPSELDVGAGEEWRSGADGEVVGERSVMACS